MRISVGYYLITLLFFSMYAFGNFCDLTAEFSVAWLMPSQFPGRWLVIYSKTIGYKITVHESPGTPRIRCKIIRCQHILLLRWPNGFPERVLLPPCLVNFTDDVPHTYQNHHVHLVNFKDDLPWLLEDLAISKTLSSTRLLRRVCKIGYLKIITNSFAYFPPVCK